METTKRAAKAMAAEKNEISIILWDMVERAHNHGKRMPLLGLLGVVYWKAAGTSVDMRVVQALGVDSLDMSFFGKNEIDALVAHGDKVVDYILSVRRPKSPEIPVVPNELTQLVMDNLLHVSEKSTIYLPYAGKCSFAEACPNASYVGEELDPLNWAIGKVCAFFKHIHADIDQNDSFNRKEKYDTIVTMPPFLFRDEKNLASIIESLYERLNDGGQMAVIVPAGFLFDVRAQYHRVKKMLLEQQALYQVVLLPAALLSSTNVSLAILLIQKGEKSEVVTMTDYSEFVVDNRKHGSIYKLDLEAIEDAERTQIMRTLNDAHPDSFVVDKETESKIRFQIRIKASDLLQAEGIDLNPKYHLNRANVLRQKENGVEFLPLQELAEIYGRANLFGGGVRVPLVRVQDLSDTILNGKKDFADLEAEERKERNLPLLMEDNLLLVALVGKTLKPTIFEYHEGRQIAYSDNLVPIKVVSPLVTVEYLQCALASDFVQEQLEANHVGAFRPFISRANLKNLMIRVPSIEEQKKIVRERKEELSIELIQKLGIENAELKNERYNEFVKEMRVRKHAIGQVLNELDPAIDMLLLCKDKNGGVLRGPDIVSPRSGYTVEEYMQKVRTLVTKVMTMVDSLTSEYVPKSEMQKYNVVSLLEEYKQNHSIEDGFELVIKHGYFTSELHVPAGIELPDGSVTEEINISPDDYCDFWSINVCKEDFFQVLDNIVANAKRYGFTESRPDYCICFEMEDIRDAKMPMVAIHVKNNGNPLPTGIKPEQVFMYGEGSSQGTGIGGWQIKQIVEGMGGKVELRTYEDNEEGFTVDYVLSLPDTSVVILED